MQRILVDAYMIYDADCGMCSFAKRVVMGLDVRRRIEAVPIQDPRAARLLEGLDEEARWSMFHVVRGDRRAGGGDGLLEVGGLLLSDRIPDLAVEMPVLRRASARLYAFLAGLRGAIQCEI